MIWRTSGGDAYALLEQMAAEHWALAPLPPIARGKYGKPFFPDHPDLYFSLSHSGGVSLCALSDTPVGIDVELVRARKPSLPAYVLSERELFWFRDRGSRWEDFYTLWTLKEARVKCTGRGLDGPPRDVQVPFLEPGESGKLDGFLFTALWGEEQEKGELRGAVCEKINNL